MSRDSANWSANSSAISLRSLTVRLGAATVLDGFDLDVVRGEFLVVVGPSGCGKSTVLNAIAGLVDPSAGEVWIDGRDVTFAEPGDRRIGMVFQSYALYPTMSVERNLSFGLRVAGTPRAEVRRRVGDAARLLQLEGLLHRRPAELSGGQRQRVAIGRAIVKEAAVFLFDEPLSNVDAQLRAGLRTEIKRLHRTLGATMIYVTHDQTEAMALADRLAVMRAGKILQLGTPRDVYRRPADVFVAGFVGSPPMCLVEGRIEAGPHGACFRAGEMAVDLPRAAAPSAGGADLVLGIRPEHVAVGVTGCAAPGLAATVDTIEATGADLILRCRTGGPVPVEIAARVDGETGFRPGDRVRLTIDPRRVCLFDRTTGKRLEDTSPD